MKIKIGTCGFRTNKIDYAALLPAVEIQQTFYQPPQTKTLERWRAAMPDGFEFALKAWQLITHEAKSPTYKRLKKTLTDEERAGAGRFQPTPIVREAWTATLAAARALGARTILFQCPASFKPYAENLENLENFFAAIERGDLNFAWEPRGEMWSERLVRDLCERHRLWHAVDPFKQITATPDRCYYRLHGVAGWRYKYEQDELEELAALLPKNRSAYVFFNNIEMTDDALRFRKIIENIKQ